MKPSTGVPLMRKERNLQDRVTPKHRQSERSRGVCVWECPKHKESFAGSSGIRRSHKAVGKRASSLLHCCNCVDFLGCSNAGGAVPWCPLKPRSTCRVSD